MLFFICQEGQDALRWYQDDYNACSTIIAHAGCIAIMAVKCGKTVLLLDWYFCFVALGNHAEIRI